MLYSNEHYFRSQNRALPQDSYSLRGSTRDLWTVQGVPLNVETAPYSKSQQERAN
jgi:hypothetical protein